MKKIIPLLLISGTFLFSISPLVAADPVSDKAKMTQMKMQKMNVNTASLEELTTLPGVGEKKAAAIIAYREKLGKFTSVDQLTEVKGIGAKMVEKMKDRISI